VALRKYLFDIKQGFVAFFLVSCWSWVLLVESHK